MFTSYTTPDGKTEPMKLDDFMAKLIPSYVSALKPWGIEPDVNKFKEFIRSGVWSRYLCKPSNTSQDNIPKGLPLILKIKIDTNPVHTVKIEWKGDKLISINYMDVAYVMDSSQIDSCESEPVWDGEAIVSDGWERSLAYYTPEYYKNELGDTSKLDEIMKDLKGA
jgi:hypothetical protein